MIILLIKSQGHDVIIYFPIYFMTVLKQGFCLFVDTNNNVQKLQHRCLLVSNGYDKVFLSCTALSIIQKLSHNLFDQSFFYK